MKKELLELINDIEILLKQDKRFYISNDHKYRNKIRELSKSNRNDQIIDVTSLVNLSKLQKQPIPEPIVIYKDPDIDNLLKVIKILTKLNDDIKKIIN